MIRGDSAQSATRLHASEIARWEGEGGASPAPERTADDRKRRSRVPLVDEQDGQINLGEFSGVVKA